MVLEEGIQRAETEAETEPLPLPQYTRQDMKQHSIEYGLDKLNVVQKEKSIRWRYIKRAREPASHPHILTTAKSKAMKLKYVRPLTPRNTTRKIS